MVFVICAHALRLREGREHRAEVRHDLEMWQQRQAAGFSHSVSFYTPCPAVTTCVYFRQGKLGLSRITAHALDATLKAQEGYYYFVEHNRRTVMLED